MWWVQCTTVTADEHAHPRRVLIFGGTFDPPHRAHATLPAKAAERLGCDLILFVPAAISPLKARQPVASPEHRLAMLLLAIADVPNARISTIELDRAATQGGGPSYTIDTLRALKAEYTHVPAYTEQSASGQPSRTMARKGAKIHRATTTSVASAAGTAQPPEFRLLIGCDQALDFHRWKDWQQILLLATPAVMLRPPWDERTFRNALEEKFSAVEAEQWMKWTLRLPVMDISATEVRTMLASGSREKLVDALDSAVLDYILANKLYRACT